MTNNTPPLRRDLREASLAQRTLVPYPGKTLGIVALVFSLLLWPVGLVLGIVAWSQSKAVGLRNPAAVVAMVIAGVWGFGVIVFIGLGL